MPPETTPQAKPVASRKSKPVAPGKPKLYHRPAEDSGQLDRRQLMALKGWSSTFLWRAMRLHALPYRKLGKKLWFIRAEIDAWCLNAPGQKPAA